jgi:DNA-binding SARP family transcriptional activator/ATP/maltotriose-dependent transcriptional regulator MalT
MHLPFEQYKTGPGGGSAPWSENPVIVLAKIRTAHPRRQPGLVLREALPSPAEHPVIVLSAPAGYGKSQLLARWCQEAGEEGRLAYGLCSRLGETASTLLALLYSSLDLQDRFQSDSPWQEQADSLLELLYELGPTTLILDDVHHLESDTSEVQECGLLLSYLLDYRAEDCHWVFSGRTKPHLADLELKAMSGQIEMLNAADLSLRASQLEELSPGQGARLFELTSGWPMACSVLLKSDPHRWHEQREKLSHGLLELAIRDLRPESKEAVAILGMVGSATRAELEAHDLWSLLEPLTESGSVIQSLGDDKLGVHPLFSEQYREQATPSLRTRAVKLLTESGRTWEALELVSDEEELTNLLLLHSESLLRAGRFRLLRKLLDRAAQQPKLAILQGRMHWHQGDPAAALECYQESAAKAQAVGDMDTVYQSWRAAGQLYIDAVCPSDAQLYLKKAYRSLGPTDNAQKADLLLMLAENAVNLGQARSARRYRSLAQSWDKQKNEDLALTSRLLLRSGRLTEARGTVQIAIKQGSLEPGRLEGHRDPRLVLSYIAALDGQAEQAIQLAQEVLDQAQEQEDRRTESAALTRLAHGHLLLERNQANPEEKSSLRLYTEADSLAKTLGLERLRAEPLMGRALYYLYQQNTPRAYEACREGVLFAQKSGDSWLSAWLGFVQAVAALDGGHPSGPELLEQAQGDFKSCRDRLGFALCDLWSAVLTGQHSTSNRLTKHLAEFPFLALRTGLFSPQATAVAALQNQQQPETPAQQLQVFCLGTLSLIRDGEPVPSKAFKRKKARELFVLLLAAPDTFFHREELAEQLWPQASQKAAIRDFRVALHALSDALEPKRPKNTTAFCIERQEERYRLLSHKLDLDITRFEALTSSESGFEEWEKAIRLYRGPFCEDYPYLESLESIRQRYDEFYLQTAEKLAAAYLENDKAMAATELAQKILVRDATWEPAYRLLLRSQHALGHEHLLPRTFTRCLETLEEQLGVEPSEETFELARELLGDQLATLL